MHIKKVTLRPVLFNKCHGWYHGLSEAWWQGLNTFKDIGCDIAHPRKQINHNVRYMKVPLEVTSVTRKFFLWSSGHQSSLFNHKDLILPKLLENNDKSKFKTGNYLLDFGKGWKYGALISSLIALVNWAPFTWDYNNWTMILFTKKKKPVKPVAQPVAYPSFCSMKWLEVFLLSSLGRVQVNQRVTPSIKFANTNLYTWMKTWGTVTVGCVMPKNAMLFSPVTVQIDLDHSKHTNNKASYCYHVSTNNRIIH